MRAQLSRFVKGAAGLSLLVAGMGAGGLGIGLATSGQASAEGTPVTGVYKCTVGLPAKINLDGAVNTHGTAPATLHIGSTWTEQPHIKFTVTGTLLALAAENTLFTVTIGSSKVAMSYSGFTGVATDLQTGSYTIKLPAPYNEQSYWRYTTATSHPTPTHPTKPAVRPTTTPTYRKTGVPPPQSATVLFEKTPITMTAATGVTATVNTLDLSTTILVAVKCHPTTYSHPVSFGAITKIKSSGSTAPLTITTTSPLPNGTVDTHYSTTLTATGGTGTYTWTQSGLPGGLSLDKTTGVISGTPTAAGTSQVHVTVTDGAAATVSKTLTLTITPLPPLTITTPSLPGGTVGTAYSATVAASGGKTPYTWSAVTLPTGLNITAGSGKISGTPSKAETKTAVVTVEGATDTTTTKTFAIKITPEPLTITTTSPLPSGVEGVHYTTTLTASGGTGTYTWSATGLPTGLTVTSASGTISGTPTEAGTFTVTAKVEDTASQTATKTLSLKINPPLAITTASLPGGTVGTAYSATVLASGGETPYTWSAVTLPAGLSITAASGKISGTPTKAETKTAGITVKGATDTSATKILQIKITPAPLKITTSTLPDGVATVHYTTTLTASGGTGTYTWSATGLPTGLTVTAGTGKISGTPTETGTFTVDATVKDTADQSVSKTLSLKIGPALAITTTSLPGGTVGTAYSATVEASGGETPYTWSATKLPTGLNITASSGKISGTPTAAGTFTAVVTVKGATDVSKTRTLPIKITLAPLKVATTSLPDGVVGLHYTTTLTASGGTGTYFWRTAKTLPPGLTLTGSSGKISGTPTKSGAFHVMVTVGDAATQTATATLTLTINPKLALTTTSLPAGTVGKTYTATLKASGGETPYSWAAKTLPPGLTVGASSGTISGTPTTAGKYTVKVTVTGATGTKKTATLSITVAAAPAPPKTTGYWMVASDGGLFSFGTAHFFGSMGGIPLNKPVVGMAATPTGGGYWEVASDGGIFAFGNAHFYGSMGGQPLNAPIVGIAATPTGGGYWEVASDGGIFAFGNAAFFGSMGGQPLNKPIVGIAAAPTGKGYWEVASDGGIFSFGTATFKGSMGGQPLNAPIVGITATATGGGYWEVASDGGIFAFGNAAFFGSMGGQPLNKPIVGITATATGGGYWMVASDGGIFAFGNATFQGSMGGQPLNQPIVGMATAT